MTDTNDLKHGRYLLAATVAGAAIALFGSAYVVSVNGSTWAGLFLLAFASILLVVVSAVAMNGLNRRYRKLADDSRNHAAILQNIQRRQILNTRRISNTANSVGRLAPKARLAIEKTLSQPSHSLQAAAPASLDSKREANVGYYPAYTGAEIEKNPRHVKVAVILDDFSREAFDPEWHQIAITPDDWLQRLDEDSIDLLFVESAWRGNGGVWKYHLTGPSAPRPALVDLVAECRQRGIPTVFWNKEDPVHRDSFLSTATLFDWVYTTDGNLIDWYKQHLGHEHVAVLKFAAQPVMHNPVRNGIRRHTRDVAFAGSYFAHRHAERREQMDLLLGAAAEASSKMDTGLEIYSRHLGGEDRYQFPEPLNSRVVGSLPYAGMLTAYRDYRVFLNVNTVVNSDTMCARRVFEISASGTPVVSTPSPAITAIFGTDEVVQVSSAGEAQNALRTLVRNGHIRDRMVHNAQRKIWEEHTYSHRADAIMASIGLSEHVRGGPTKDVSALVPTNRPQQIEHILENVGRQVAVELQLVLLTHGFRLDLNEITYRAKDYGIGRVVVLEAEQEEPLGACMNRLIDAADGAVVAKMDDDDFYGVHYLQDQLNALWYSGADVVGKQARYMYLAASDVTVLRMPQNEHKFINQVSGPTLLTPKDVALETQFPPIPRGSDSGFLERVCGDGGRVYSADRFNFVQYRSPDANDHTWKVSESDLMATSELVYPGRAFAHAMQ